MRFAVCSSDPHYVWGLYRDITARGEGCWFRVVNHPFDRNVTLQGFDLTHKNADPLVTALNSSGIALSEPLYAN